MSEKVVECWAIINRNGKVVERCDTGLSVHVNKEDAQADVFEKYEEKTEHYFLVPAAKYERLVANQRVCDCDCAHRYEHDFPGKLLSVIGEGE